MNGVSSGGAFTNTYALALSPSGTTAQEFQMVETDDTGSSASGQHSSGYCYQDTIGVFASSTIGGASGNGFAFGTRGENGGGVPRAFVGRFDTDSAGNVTGGYVDGESVSKGADGGGWAGTTTTTVGASLTGGSYGTTVDSNGRFTLALIGASGTTANFEGYIVDTNRMFLLETDAAASNGLSAGEMRLQTGNTPSTGSGITGSAVIYGQGWEYGSSVTGYDSDVMQLGFSNGNSASVQGTVNEAYQDSNGTYQGGSNNNALHQSVTFNLDSKQRGPRHGQCGRQSLLLLLRHQLRVLP